MQPWGRLALGGEFFRTVDFDPTEGVDLHSVPGQRLQPDFYVSRWQCGGCDALYAHTVRARHGAVRAAVTTALPGGRAKLTCRSRAGEAEVTRTVRLDDTGRAGMRLAPLPPGKVRCVIKRLRDADGRNACSGPQSPRRAAVK